MNIKNALVNASVMHKRLRPRINQFVYKAYYICFNIAKISELKSLFFSINKFNIFSINNRDYGAKDGSNIESWIRKILQEENIKADGEIFLFTHPRVFGYVFNPVTFWFCLNAKSQLIAVLAQVNNTFGEHHNYLIFEKNGDAINEQKFYEANKEFHVSPFMNLEGKYQFRFVFKEQKIAVFINYYNNLGEEMLLTSVIGKRLNLKAATLFKNFFSIPFLTFKVITLIHYQALKLVIKKIKYIAKPIKPINKITKSK